MDHLGYRFVVIEKDAFIGRDLADGLRDALSGCEVRLVAHDDDARAVIDGLALDDPRSTVIITKMSLDQIDRCGLPSLSLDHSVLIVVRDGDDPASAIEDRGWLRLASPFTSDDLTGLAAALTERRQAA